MDSRYTAAVLGENIEILDFKRKQVGKTRISKRNLCGLLKIPYEGQRIVVSGDNIEIEPTGIGSVIKVPVRRVVSLYRKPPRGSRSVADYVSDGLQAGANGFADGVSAIAQWL